jgi:hypothetical protein
MTDWEAVEREQRETYQRAVESGDTSGLPLFICDFRMNIQRCREVFGMDREKAKRLLMPPPANRRRGGLTPEEFLSLFDEEWPD